MQQGFTITHRLESARRVDPAGNGGGHPLGRVGVIHTPHGPIRTPAFIPVGTKATVKGVLPETMAALGAQALLANAYHLFLQPGPDIVDTAGGLGRFMHWDGPTFTDSGGFQVMSLGVGFKKVLAMETTGVVEDDVIAPGRERLAAVDEDGVTFTSHLDGRRHRFSPEVSMAVQHQLGADIIFAFDECTTLLNSRGYQQASVARTERWAVRCLAEHQRQHLARPHRPNQMLFGVIQGAQHEDLRRHAARTLGDLRVTIDGQRDTTGGEGFAGFGIGGALEKQRLGTIVGWVDEELPEDRPRHLLGIGEPEDLFTAIEAGADTFDCVAPARKARNATLFTATGRLNVVSAANRRAFEPVDATCDCYTCTHYTRAYLHHCCKSREMLGPMLATIHNERFIVRLVDQIRQAMVDGRFAEFRTEMLGRYTAGTRTPTV